MAIETYYDQTITWKRWDGTLDALGAPDLSIANYDAIFSSIPCLKIPMNTTDKIAREKKVSDKMFWIYCQVLAIREDDIGTIGSDNFKIIGIKDPNTIGHHMEVECEIVQ